MSKEYMTATEVLNRQKLIRKFNNCNFYYQDLGILVSSAIRIWKKIIKKDNQDYVIWIDEAGYIPQEVIDRILEKSPADQDRNTQSD